MKIFWRIFMRQISLTDYFCKGLILLWGFPASGRYSGRIPLQTALPVKACPKEDVPVLWRAGGKVCRDCF
ncbi:hypothetical protein E0W58_01570 [Neisseria meningitidis]|nr:hypothetical protein A6J54_14110 [Neisseria meningitidis]AVH83324.1 hypothetical protein A6J50_14345 [Neisseria meningitidis]AVI44329.1 hypothetical protein A6J53_14930 [Neisseria meningitidis]MBG8579940.1 hypothetical protein [Neisseria meningitidis]MBG8588602.1 hypothetical protein [Neisseria meningitidis]